MSWQSTDINALNAIKKREINRFSIIIIEILRFITKSNSSLVTIYNKLLSAYERFNWTRAIEHALLPCRTHKYRFQTNKKSVTKNITRFLRKICESNLNICSNWAIKKLHFLCNKDIMTTLFSMTILLPTNCQLFTSNNDNVTYVRKMHFFL